MSEKEKSTDCDTSNFTGNYNGSYNESVADPPDAFLYYVLFTYIAPCVICSFAVVGIAGNCLVIYVILSKKAMKTVTNLLILNLALADMSYLSICAPFTAYKYIESWPGGVFSCRVVNTLAYLVSYITIYTLVAISALRYLTIVWSVNSAWLRTKKNIGILSLFIWLVMMAMNIPIFYFSLVNTFGNYSYCGLYKLAIKAILLTYFIAAYALPLIIISLLYLLIICHLKRNNVSTIDQTHARERTARACRLIVAVVLVFGISWLPLHVQNMVALFGTLPGGFVYEVFRVLFTCMTFCNSCLNPFIYNFASQDFKKNFIEVIGCCVRFKRKRNGSKDRSKCTTEMTRMV